MLARRALLTFALALAALLLVGLLPASASAQTIPAPLVGKPTPADDATAKRAFESGLKLYGEGAYAEALIAFEQSYRLGGRPSALKNIAQCHRNLKHFVEAHEAYEQMLSAHEAQLSAPDKAAVRQALEELSILTGTLQLTTSEADAEITIDGKPWGRSPIARPKRLTVAAHQVRVTKGGFQPFEQTFNVGSQEAKSLDVKLEVEKTTGHLVVREPNGRDVHVFVDGHDEGPLPWEGELSAGEHTVEAKGPRFASEARKLKIVAKERSELTLDATPLLGRLRVSTSPATASIAVDGRDVGTGAWEGELPEGIHRIEVAVPGAPPQVREVTVGRGQLVVQEIPIAVAMTSAPVVDYRGIYVRLSLMSAHPVTGLASNEVAGLTSQSSALAIGAATALRGGYSFGWLGVEGVVLVMLEHREDHLDFGPPQARQSLKDQTTALQGFAGIGARVTSKDDSVRFTFGLAPGVSKKRYTLDRSLEGSPLSSTNTQSFGNPSSSSSSQAFNDVSYTAFGFVADGGILIGSTPGSKFFLGVHGWIDFPPSDLVVGPDTTTLLPNEAFRRPGRGVLVTEGVQFFFGPTLGVQFGH